MTEDHRVPLLLVTGLAAGPNTFLTDTLRREDPHTAVVHHDLRELRSGVVRRRLQLGPRDQLTALELAHGCVSCTLREDLLPLLRQLSGMPQVRRIVVRLDEVMEPEPVCWELCHTPVEGRPVIDDVRIEAVVAVVETRSWFDDATGEDTVGERGLVSETDDQRTVAQVALAQVEYADVVALTQNAPDPWTAAKTHAVLHRVAPEAAIVDLSMLDTDRLRAATPAGATRGGIGDITDPHGPLLRGTPPLQPDCGIALNTFTVQRPFHPERLHESLGVLLDGVVRARGRAWVASQPDTALWIESAGGGLVLGHAGPWLAAPDGPAWEDVTPERRTLASLRWHPDFGDRAQELVIVTHHADPADIHETLRAALLTDDELARGRHTWAGYPDPFGHWHEEPCDDTERSPAPRHTNQQAGQDETR